MSKSPDSIAISFCTYLLLLWGGILQSVPSTVAISDLLYCCYKENNCHSFHEIGLYSYSMNLSFVHEHMVCMSGFHFNYFYPLIFRTKPMNR
jgi:hypothetical protein